MTERNLINARDIFLVLQSLADTARCRDVRCRYDSGFDSLLLEFMWSDGLTRSFLIGQLDIEADFNFLGYYAERARREEQAFRKREKEKADAEMDSTSSDRQVNSG